MPFGFGFNQSNQQASSTATGSAQSSSFVDPNQAPFLDFLRNSAQGVTGQQMGGVAGLFGTAQGLGQQGQGFLGGLTNNPFLSALQGQAGGNPELVAAQTQQLGQDIGQFTQEQVLPGIRRDAVGSMGLGGGRQGVAEGIAAQGAQRAFSQGALGFQTADAMRSQQAAQAGGQLFGQGSQTGLNSLQSMFNLAQSPFQAQYSPLLNLSAIIGGPTVLGQSESERQASSQSTGDSFGFNVANAVGFT